MDLELLNKISKLTFYGYYDPSKNMVAVHFFNQKEDKADVIAFLNRNLTWDVREILAETSVLHSDREIITVEHKSLGIQASDSDFDKFVRVGLKEMAIAANGPEFDFEGDKMFQILNNGYRDDN